MKRIILNDVSERRAAIAEETKGSKATMHRQEYLAIQSEFKQTVNMFNEATKKLEDLEYKLHKVGMNMPDFDKSRSDYLVFIREFKKVVNSYNFAISSLGI